jgi:hypothetical protein
LLLASAKRCATTLQACANLRALVHGPAILRRFGAPRACSVKTGVDAMPWRFYDDAMLISTITITISLTLAIFWMLSQSGRRARPTRRAQRYHSVSVETPDAAERCAACEALRGQRFLVSSAPPLPVPGCTAHSCACRYVHHDDRRASAARRRHDRGLHDRMPLIADRRLQTDRRGRPAPA